MDDYSRYFGDWDTRNIFRETVNRCRADGLNGVFTSEEIEEMFKGHTMEWGNLEPYWFHDLAVLLGFRGEEPAQG